MTGKVSSIKDKQPLCPYCGAVPATEHPEYSCPRIESVSISNDGTDVEFIAPKKWIKLKKELTGE